MKIVSLLPSATEIICILGLENSLVGVTHECDYPPSVAQLPKVTHSHISPHAASKDIDHQVREHLIDNRGLYSLNRELLRELEPDLIVTQALCDVCAVAAEEVHAAASELPGPPRVLNLEPALLEDVFDTLLCVGRACEISTIAESVVYRLRARVNRVRELTDSNLDNESRPKVAFLEWIDPLFSSGHWNPALIEWAGGRDYFGSPGQPSSTLDWKNVLDENPDVLFIACCGYPTHRALQDIPILEQKPGWLDLKCVQNHRVYVADGNAYFSRPGPRLVDSLEILAHALHPDIHRKPRMSPATAVY